MDEMNLLNALRLTAQAENALVGCLLVEPADTVATIKGILSESDFQSQNARIVYATAVDLVSSGKPCDPVLIQSEAAARGTVLDNEYCIEAMRMFVTTANAAETARIIHEAALARKARGIGVALAQDELTPVEALKQLQELLSVQNSRIHTPHEAAMCVMDYIEDKATGKSKPFLSTGYTALDAQLSGGFVAGGLITVAARPGTGKTTVALNIAEKITAMKETVLYISLEMTEEQLWACRLANSSGLNRSSIYAGKIASDDENSWKRLIRAIEQLYDRPFFIRDVPSSIEDIEREARCLDNIALIVVDHIGLIRPATAYKGNRYEFMTDVSHRLKQLALSMGIPILALCQLNRQSELRDSKRPNMADLRDSGAIEEDSDVVCLLFRESQYLPEEERPKPWEVQDIDFLIEKNRHGMTGRVTLDYYGPNCRIMERTVPE